MNRPMISRPGKKPTAIQLLIATPILIGMSAMGLFFLFVTAKLIVSRIVFEANAVNVEGKVIGYESIVKQRSHSGRHGSGGGPVRIHYPLIEYRFENGSIDTAKSIVGRSGYIFSDSGKYVTALVNPSDRKKHLIITDRSSLLIVYASAIMGIIFSIGPLVLLKIIYTT